PESATSLLEAGRSDGPRDLARAQARALGALGISAAAGASLLPSTKGLLAHLGWWKWIGLTLAVGGGIAAGLFRPLQRPESVAAPFVPASAAASVAAAAPEASLAPPLPGTPSDEAAVPAAATESIPSSPPHPTASARPAPQLSEELAALESARNALAAGN